MIKLLDVLKRISWNTYKLREINTMSLIVTIFFGVLGLIIAYLGYRVGKDAFDFAREPYADAFSVEFEDDQFVLGKTATKKEGFAEVFFCQNGTGMLSLMGTEFPEREFRKEIPNVNPPYFEINSTLPVSYLVHIWYEDVKESSYAVFDQINHTQIRSGVEKDRLLVCSDIR